MRYKTQGKQTQYIRILRHGTAGKAGSSPGVDAKWLSTSTPDTSVYTSTPPPPHTHAHQPSAIINYELISARAADPDHFIKPPDNLIFRNSEPKIFIDRKINIRELSQSQENTTNKLSNLLLISNI